MVEQAEKLWTFDAVDPGQYGAETVVAINAGNIAGYAQVALNDDPRYRGAGASLAMPTMVLAYAPLLREEIAEANGFIAQEQSKTARRQTPFAKCEIRWHQPVGDGDTITGTRGVLEKYERRGNKFVPLRLEAHNDGGEKLAEIDHTSIFKFRKSDQPRPASRAAPRRPAPDFEPAPLRETSPDDAVKAVTFETIEVGDAVHPFTIHSPLKTEVDGVAVPEDKMSAQSSESNHEPGRFPWGRMHGVGGITIIGYLDAMLHRWAPDGTLYGGGRLLFKAIKNFRPGDTNTYRGTVTAKREHDGKHLVDIEITGVNQLGQLTGVAEATLVF